MICYIVDRKINNFNRTFGFAITVAVAICCSLHVYILSAFAFFVPHPLLRLLCLVHFCVLCALSASTSSIPHPLLCSLCFVGSVYVYCTLVSCLLVCFFHSLLRLRLLYLGELSTCLRPPRLILSAFAMPQ